VEEPSWLVADSLDLSRFAAPARASRDASVGPLAPAAPSLRVEYTLAPGEEVRRAAAGDGGLHESLRVG
jgi:hypothetical protein